MEGEYVNFRSGRGRPRRHLHPRPTGGAIVASGMRKNHIWTCLEMVEQLPHVNDVISCSYNEKSCNNLYDVNCK
jgi:hypothetical protein